jgi:hypothetical protein
MGPGFESQPDHSKKSPHRRLFHFHKLSPAKALKYPVNIIQKGTLEHSLTRTDTGQAVFCIILILMRCPDKLSDCTIFKVGL